VAGLDSETLAPAADYAADEVLRDGGSIHIRAIRPDDRERLREHFHGLSEKSIYFRFFGLKRSLNDAELTRLTNLDFVDHVALAATLRDDRGERFIGVARYIRCPDRSRAEVAFAVLDEHQGRGIGTLLLEHLSRIARAGGIVELQADVLGDNNRMLGVFANSGYKVTRSAEAGVIHVAFPTAETQQSVEAIAARERVALAHSVEWILKPRSVAVIGASRNSGKLGGAILRNLLQSGYKGKIFPVNKAAEQVSGLRCYPSVAAIGEQFDLAIVVVPAGIVETELAACAKAGARAAIVVTAGFGESGAEGAARERRIFELARRSGMRLVGPNCLGVINTDAGVRLNATFAPVEPPPGRVGMFSQSGALGVAILDHARQRRLGLSTFISAGNRADVSNNDLMAYWADDANTSVVALYLETVGNPRTFSRLAREVARRKPIVAVKSGRHGAAVRAIAGQSSAFATVDLAVDALFEQTGVIRTETLEQMFDVAALLAAQPIPGGPRVGIVTNAHGPAVLLADACESRGLELAARGTSADGRQLDNPVDLGVNAGGGDFAAAIAELGGDSAVDAVVAIYVPPIASFAREVAAGIARGASDTPTHKPVLSVFVSTAGRPLELDGGSRGVIPCYDFPENAAAALASAFRYGRWRARAPGEIHRLSDFARDATRAIIERLMRESGAGAWLKPADAAALLRTAGIEVAPAEQADVATARRAADRIGYPLVAKAVAPGLIHKSDVGGVIMNLRSGDEAENAARRLAERMESIGARLDGVLLQRQIDGGHEMMAGVASDATFGPLLFAGLGGIAAEILKDVSFRLHPVTDSDAREMVGELRSSRMLDGYRGGPRGDREAFAALIAKLSALVEHAPEIGEMHLNPIKVLEPGRGVVVVDARIRLAGAPR
jgi:acyl-CoA synthetase (NDP forming)/RimJ/RimL family protein N-acetyltransferase